MYLRNSHSMHQVHHSENFSKVTSETVLKATSCLHYFIPWLHHHCKLRFLYSDNKFTISLCHRKYSHPNNIGISIKMDQDSYFKIKIIIINNNKKSVKPVLISWNEVAWQGLTQNCVHFEKKRQRKNKSVMREKLLEIHVNKI